MKLNELYSSWKLLEKIYCFFSEFSKFKRLDSGPKYLLRVCFFSKGMEPFHSAAYLPHFYGCNFLKNFVYMNLLKKTVFKAILIFPAKKKGHFDLCNNSITYKKNHYSAIQLFRKKKQKDKYWVDPGASTSPQSPRTTAPSDRKGLHTA